MKTKGQVLNYLLSQQKSKEKYRATEMKLYQ